MLSKVKVLFYGGFQAAPVQRPSCSTLLPFQRRCLLPLHLLCQTCCCPVSLLLPSLGTGTASGTAGGAPTRPVGGKAKSSGVEGQEKAGVGLDVGHLPHPSPQPVLRDDPAALLWA